ncbi:hepatitis A virus cellular receptor 1 isoform 1-T1 [Spinachia spinachia]
MMKILLLLALLTGTKGSSVVVGLPGGGVSLPCTYNSGRYGLLSVCWGRGSIPTSGCRGLSDRHRLLGRLEDGDVSMTILNVSRADAGRYGCRVDIPGWFNDDKHHFDVVVEEASQSTTSMMPTVDTTTDQDTTGHVTSTLHLPTSSSSGIMAEGSSSVSVVLVCVLLGLASLVAAALVVTALRRPRHGKTEPAVENVYQMEADGGEYESCP